MFRRRYGDNPLYAVADSAAHFRLFRRARPLPHVAGVPWINYLRVPVGLSLLLLLVWWPLILSDATGTSSPQRA